MRETYCFIWEHNVARIGNVACGTLPRASSGCWITRIS